jgi:hypothetical protein
MHDRDTVHLRVLIANERQDRLALVDARAQQEDLRPRALNPIGRSHQEALGGVTPMEVAHRPRSQNQ